MAPEQQPSAIIDLSNDVDSQPQALSLVEIFDVVLERAVNWDKEGQFSGLINESKEGELFERLQSESQIWDLISDPTSVKHTDLLSRAVAIPALPSTQGHYLGIMTDEKDPSWFRRYVGQAKDVRRRVQTHNTSRGQDKPLFYFTWKDGRKVFWVLLSTVAGLDMSAEDRAAWLSVQEMFYALVLKSLQPNALVDWLNSAHSDEGGLNVRLPLYQGQILRGTNSGFGQLYASSDPEKKSYAVSHIGRISQMAIPVNDALDYAHTAAGITRAKGKTTIREWVDGDPEGVVLRCNNCKPPDSDHVDHHPRFYIPTGQFVADQARCHGNCEPTEKRKKKNLVKRVCYHTPINLPRDSWITIKAINKLGVVELQTLPAVEEA